MPDDPWSVIHAQPRDLRGVGGAPRHETPVVLRPTCPQHCSGVHDHEAVFECPRGHGTMYLLVAHEWVYTAGHYFYTREPQHGAPALDPKAELPPCRTCGSTLRRR